jgi:hypothetical protein
MRNVSDKSYKENQNTHFVFSDCIPNIVPFLSYVPKYGRARQATDINIFICRKYEICMLDKLGYRHTFIKYNTYCFCTAKLVTRKYVSAPWNLFLRLSVCCHWVKKTGLISYCKQRDYFQFNWERWNKLKIFHLRLYKMCQTFFTMSRLLQNL